MTASVMVGTRPCAGARGKTHTSKTGLCGAPKTQRLWWSASGLVLGFEGRPTQAKPACVGHPPVWGTRPPPTRLIRTWRVANPLQSGLTFISLNGRRRCEPDWEIRNEDRFIASISLGHAEPK